MDAVLALLVSLTWQQWVVVAVSCSFTVLHLLDESGLIFTRDLEATGAEVVPLWTATERWHQLGGIGWGWGFAGLFVQSALLCGLAVRGAAGDPVALSLLVGARISDTLTTHLGLSVWHRDLLPGSISAACLFVPELVLLAHWWGDLTTLPVRSDALFIGLIWFPLTWAFLRALGSIGEGD